MYIMRVPPLQSSKWQPPEGEDLVTADSLFLEPGARSINKQEAAGMEGEQQVEALPTPTAEYGVHDVSGSGVPVEASGVQ